MLPINSFSAWRCSITANISIITIQVYGLQYNLTHFKFQLDCIFKVIKKVTNILKFDTLSCSIIFNL